MNTAPHLYDNDVAGPNGCALTQDTRPAYVPTAGNPQCLIGYTCELRTFR